jgi:glycosyltransferase involved in cell wall biosynthesis
MKRLAQERRVYFFEEPIHSPGQPALGRRMCKDRVTVVTPYLPEDLEQAQQITVQRHLLRLLCRQEEIRNPLLWYYTPMSGQFSDHLAAEAVVYDCMDELAAFRGAPPSMVEEERKLLQRAAVVFTGGHSLYEAKRHLHANVHPFPSGVDIMHFVKAREPLPQPHDQARIPHPRIGHYAVIDERLDTALVANIADTRPEWQLILVGPVVKINREELPRRQNIHYIGMKSYEELPAYLAGWDAAFMPFALNESTRFISPTKTPEYLAAGKAVVSTPIMDVVRTYGDRGLVRIASTTGEFAAALEACLAEEQEDRRARLQSTDRLLQAMSWDGTWAAMKELLA